MPALSVKQIISFSSENEKHLTQNLLSLNPNKTWRCEIAGEKSCYVLLQLQKPSTINGIDIGNDHSAFVEIFVSRAGSNNFEVLLPMSSLMTPVESRNSSLTNRVRMFTASNFSSETKDKKWDQVKVVCTQPFNTHVTYGLAFIKISGKEDEEYPKNTLQTVKKNEDFVIGRFKFREDSPKESALERGSLFARRKELNIEDKDKSSLTPAVAIRNASTSNTYTSKSNKLANSSKTKINHSQETAEIPKLNRNRDSLLYDDEDDRPNERLDKLLEKDKKAKELEKEHQSKQAQKIKLNKESHKTKLTKEHQAHNQESVPSAVKRKRDEPTVVTNANTPKKNTNNTGNKTSTPSIKGNLSDASTSKHTHKLNTPAVQKQYKSFNKLFEKVVFVLSGFENPLRSNLRTKALEMGATYQPNWNDRCTHLICAFANTPKYNQVKGKGKIVKKSWIEDCHSQQKYIPWRRYSLVPSDLHRDESDEEIFNITTSPDFGSSTKNTSMFTSSQNSRNNENDEIDVFDMSTEIEEEVEKSKQFFNGKVFYIDEGVGAVAAMKLKTIIQLLGGTIDELLTNDIDYNVTNSKNNNFTEVISVMPEWIYECNDMEICLPIKRYIL